MEECVNNELYDGNKNYLIEENKTKLHGVQGYDIEVNLRRGGWINRNLSSTSGEVDDKNKRGEYAINEGNMHESFEGDKRNDNSGGDDVSLVEESEMRSSKDSVNDDDDLVNGFDASTCSGDNIYGIFDNEDKTITEDLNGWVNTNKNWVSEAH